MPDVQAKARTILSSMAAMAKDERLEKGIYIMDDELSTLKKAPLCNGYRACAIGSLYLSAGIKPKKYGALPGTLRTDSYVARVTDPDWHSHSYVNPDQLAAVLKAYGRIGKKVWGGKVDDYSPDPEVYGWLGAMRALAKRPGVKNVRLVYWFDN